MNQLTFTQLTPAQQDSVLLELHGRGYNYTQLHRITGLSVSWIRRRVLNLGVTPHPGARPLPVPASQIAKEYQAGASIETLAKRYDSYYKQIRNTLLDEGVELRPSTRPKNPDLKQPPPNPGPLFKKLYVEDDRTMAEIMAEYDITYRQLRNRLREQDVTIRERGPQPIEEPAPQEMIDDYAVMDFKAMGLKYHMDRVTMSRRLALAGVEIRKPGRPRRNRH